jgi:hypothetical protein
MISADLAVRHHVHRPVQASTAAWTGTKALLSTVLSLKPGVCRKTLPAGDRWHIRQPVPAATFTAVLPRGSSGDTGGARWNRQGDGDTAEGSVFGGPETWGGRREPGGPVWPLEVPVRGAGRPPPATSRHL